MGTRNLETRPVFFHGATSAIRVSRHQAVRGLVAAAALLAIGGLAASASASTLYWTTSGTNTNWDASTSDVNWATAAGGAASTYWSDGNEASFQAGGAFTVTLNGAVAPTAINISNNSNVTIADGTGTPTIDLGSGGLTDTNGYNQPASIAADIELGASQTWNLGTYTELTVSGVISEANAGTTLTVTAGTTADPSNLLLAGANTYTGGTIINGGSVTVENNGALGAGTVTFGPAAGSPPAPASTLTANTTSAPITIANNIDVNGASTVVDLGNSNDSNPFNYNTFSINGNITGGGAGSEIAFGVNNFAFGGNNSGYTGSIGVYQGLTLTSLDSGDANANWTGGDVYGYLGIAAGTAGTVDLGALSGDVSVESRDGKFYTVDIGGAGLTETYSGNIGATSYNNLKIVLVGGQETFTGGSTYNGGTAVQGGTLLVDNATGSGTGTGTVTVDAAGTFGGSGIIKGDLTSDGTLMVGDAAGTILHANGGTTLGNNSTLDISLDTANVSGGTSGDGLLSTTSLAWGTGITVAVNPATFGGVGTYALIDYSSTSSNPLDLGTWTATGLSGFHYSFSLGTDNGLNAIDLSVSAVPEPSALGLLGLGGLGLLLLGRRRSV